MKNLKIANTRKTTSLLKKYFLEKYKIKTSIRTSKYSMGSSLNIEWNFGPSPKMIEKEINRLQYGKFDSMNDIYNMKNDASTSFILDGYLLETQKYVFAKREIPEEFRFRCAKMISDAHRFSDVFKLESLENFYKSFDKPFGPHWTWSDLVRPHLYNANFAFIDDSEITNLALVGDYNEGFHWTYEYNGQKYDTKEIEVKEAKELSIIKEKVIVQNDVRMIEYSDKAIAVIGNSYEIKEDLKKLGGRFNRFLKVDDKKVPGWIFSKSKTNEVSNLLIDYSKR